MGISEEILALLVEKYSNFVDYLESSESKIEYEHIEKYRLLDFYWEFKQSIFDSEEFAQKRDLRFGVFLYKSPQGGPIKKFKCLVPLDMAE